MVFKHLAMLFYTRILLANHAVYSKSRLRSYAFNWDMNAINGRNFDMPTFTKQNSPRQISVSLTPSLIRSVHAYARDREISFSAGLRRLARLGLAAEQSRSGQGESGGNLEVAQ